MNDYDYIIVGAGSAGCVLADRLSANGLHRVLLIEAGPEDRNPLVRMPRGFGKLLSDPTHAWHLPVTVDPASGRTQEIWARGKMLGGSSAINGMVYMRGHPADYDEWAANGASGWGWETMAKAFRSIEDHALGETALRGGKGPLKVGPYAQRCAVSEAVIQACESLGLPRKLDINELDHEGVAYLTYTLSGGVRQSAAHAFLEPARKRFNLKVLTDTQVQRVLFEGQRAVGVSARHGNAAPCEYRARREVILCAGALQSPRLLQLSGIGNSSLLGRLGIPVIAHSPNVGQNMREHLLCYLQARLSTWRGSQNREFSGVRLLKNVIQYGLARRGVMALGSFPVGGFFKTRPDLDRPDAQLMMAPYSMDFSSPTYRFEPHPGMQLFTYPLRPRSQGSVTIESADPAQPARIVTNYLADEYDRQVSIGAFRVMRKVVASAPMKHLVTAETYPGAQVQSDEQILEEFRQRGQSGYHACGTCAMGADSASVLDPRLRVRGVQGLRVMDLSVIPSMISGNTNGPMMAMAWRAAELILEDVR
ncbi:GMC family oxidoreductase [Pseudomonas sp. TYF_14]|uniref:GMC family oxidoreductase n=1 Tax=Pseudomonas sp. TYF_14 TaxID=3367193 RepID=UPI00370CF2E6